MPDLTGTCTCWTPHPYGQPCITEEQQAERYAQSRVLRRAARLLRRDSALGRFTAPVVIDAVRSLLDHDQETAAVVVLRSYATESTANRILTTLSELRSDARTLNRRSLVTRPAALLTALALTGAVAACGGTTGGATGTATVEPTAAATASAADGGSVPTTDPAPAATADDSPAKVGTAESYTWDDGLRAQVIEAKRTSVTEEFIGKTNFVSVVVQLRNGTKATFNTATLQVSLRYGAAGEEAQQVYTLQRYDGITGNIPVGKIGTGRYAFTVPTGRYTLTVEVSPGFSADSMQYGPAFFEANVS